MFKFIVALLAIVGASAFRSAAPARMGSSLQMKSASKAAAAFFAGAMIMSPAAFAKDIEAGEAVFAGNCAACHAGGNNVIQNEKTLRKEALEQYLAGGLKEESIIYQVTNGKNAMPAFGGRLDESDIVNVAAYVYDQATGAKWD